MFHLTLIIAVEKEKGLVRSGFPADLFLYFALCLDTQAVVSFCIHMPRCPVGGDMVPQSRHPLAFVRWRMLWPV